MCHVARTTLRCEPTAVRSARAWVREQLGVLYPALDSDLVDDAGLAVSELVTNCVRADAHELTVSLTAHRGDVTLATTDDAPGLPVRVSASPGMATGRGLQIVEALTTAWGVAPAEGRKTVWGRFALADPSGSTFACDH